MKTLFIFLIIAIRTFTVTAQNDPDRILGVWTSDEKDSHVEIYKYANTYCGRIIWIKDPYDKNGYPKRDINNPDPKKRAQKIVGMTMLTGLKYKNNQWVSGSIYGPRRGAYANCDIKMDDKGQLHITVYQGMLSATKIWTRL